MSRQRTVNMQKTSSAKLGLKYAPVTRRLAQEKAHRRKEETLERKARLRGRKRTHRDPCRTHKAAICRNFWRSRQGQTCSSRICDNYRPRNREEFQVQNTSSYQKPCQCRLPATRRDHQRCDNFYRGRRSTGDFSTGPTRRGKRDTSESSREALDSFKVERAETPRFHHRLSPQP